MKEPLIIDELITIPGGDLEWAAARSSGHGGQNVNKVSSKVELRFDLEHTSALTEETKDRLRSLARSRLDAEGKIVVVSQLTRDQPRNLEDALAKLSELILRALHVPKTRRPTKPTYSSKQRRCEGKRIRGLVKANRQQKGADD